jgi:hypothetical protein
MAETGIKYIIIRLVRSNYYACDIVRYFYNNNIAEISSVTLLPAIHLSREASREFNVCYITIKSWLSSSKAMLFSLNYKKEGHIIEMPERDIWNVIINNEGNGRMNLDYYTLYYNEEVDRSLDRLLIGG